MTQGERQADYEADMARLNMAIMTNWERESNEIRK